MVKKLSIMLLTCLLSALTVNLSFAREQEQTAKPVFVGVNSAPGKVVKQFHQALHNVDQVNVRRLLADEVIIFEAGAVERSAKEYAQQHMLADMKFLSATESKLLEQTVKITGNSALAMSRVHIKGKYRGKAIDYQSLETLVLEKISGQWKIVHIHWSH
ncbi:SnoaL-like domain-containing protein [Colwellia chukchiensis]|uniref:SnoaL-like domain-containing protein n=1 Tax=Colwellia chukchiensis TaxID=641665 RepID=A0A1H7NCA5_9GAMM|nr:nuclear transport factor 2 family protein [Colwellia chukchiensis]SEL21246.1 SnoaL-like domain-containing protein [Colwellia chukchiensis]